LDGHYWNTAVRITKIILSQNIGSYQQEWQISLVDEASPALSLSNNWLYFQSTFVDSLVNTISKLRRINPDNGETIWADNIGEPNEYGIANVIANDNNVIAHGLHYGDYRPIMVNYDSEGIQTWSYSAPLPTGFEYASYADVVWDDNNILILGGTASYSNQTAANCRPWLSAVSFTVATDNSTIPDNSTSTCYPNPFRGNTNIKFTQIENSPTTVSIYNIKGQLIKTLIDRQNISPGEHFITWDGKNGVNKPVAPGVYFYKMNSGRFSSTTGKIILMK
jgi:hypothetical protein